MKMFQFEGGKFPVIFIVDNDDAGKGLIRKAEKIRDDNRNAKKITEKRHAAYYFENIYILSIPNVDSHGKAVKDIEDLFDEATLWKTLNGKTFYKKNTGLDPDKHYGKAFFSEYVIKQNKKSINFNEFNPLLVKIVDVIKDFDTNKLD